MFVYLGGGVVQGGGGGVKPQIVSFQTGSHHRDIRPEIGTRAEDAEPARTRKIFPDRNFFVFFVSVGFLIFRPKKQQATKT